jgi:protein-S-isoprenylcysteine O-methyltransferase Ste14
MIAPAGSEAGAAGSTAGVWIPPPLLYAAGFAVGVGLQLGFKLPAPGAAAAIIGGGLLVAAGSALALSSVRLFRSAGTPLDPARPTRALVTSGPYRLTRNPIYLGFALLYAGIALLVGAIGALITLPVVVFVVDRYVIAREERYLARAFEGDYARYRTKVRRWL